VSFDLMTLRGRKWSRCWVRMKRIRFRSCSSNCRYPLSARAGETRPWDSRKRSFETEMSGNSSRNNSMTSPMLSVSSGIAVNYEEMESPDEYFVPCLQFRRVDPGLVDVGAVGRARVLHRQLSFLDDESAMVSRHSDVVQEYVAVGMAPHRRYPGIEDEGHPRPRPLLDDQSESSDPFDCRCLRWRERMLLAVLQRQIDHRRIVVELRTAVGAEVRVLGDRGLAVRAGHRRKSRSDRRIASLDQTGVSGGVEQIVRVETVGGCHRHEPALSVRVAVDEVGRVDEVGIDLRDGSCEWGVDLGDGFGRFDLGDHRPLLELRARFGQLDEDDV